MPQAESSIIRTEALCVVFGITAAKNVSPFCPLHHQNPQTMMYAQFAGREAFSQLSEANFVAAKRTFIAMVVLVCAIPALAQTKAPVPSAETQQKALALIKEVYRKQYEAAKTSAQKEDFAKKLFQRAGETANTTNKYALLRVARDLSIQAAGPTAFDAVDEMSKHYQIDGLAMQSKVLAAYAKKAKRSTENKAVAEKALALTERALAEYNLSVATQLGEIALSTARKARDTTLLKKVVAVNKKTEGLAKATEGIKEALAKLDVDPTDPAANLQVGKFYCFVRGDWDKGLSYLALGNDPRLKTLAVKELEGPKDVNEQTALGDGWWDLSEKADETTKKQLRARAGYWYRKAVPKLTGLMKDKVEGRIKECAKDAGASSQDVPLDRWVSLMDGIDIDKDAVYGNWHASADGLSIAAKGWTETGGKCARLMLPVVAEGDYDFEVAFTRRSGTDSVMIIFPVGHSHCLLILDSHHGKYSGILGIDGRGVDDTRNLTRKVGKPLVNGRRYTAHIRVRTNEDKATIDIRMQKSAYIHWVGPQKSVSLKGNNWALPDPRRPGLGANDCAVTFHDARLRLVSGRGSFVQPPKTRDR